MELRCHVYSVPGITNVRDLGGYCTADGRTLAKGRFIRSTALAGLDGAGEDALLSLGIDCVIDLRSSMERKRAPDIFEQDERIYFQHIPMLDYISSNIASGDFTSFPASMAEMYIGLLEHGGDSFKEAFTLFADERFSHYLFHCTAGKDRTGVMAMLLLALAGVDDETIIEDYSYTEALLAPEPLGMNHPGVPAYLFSALPDTMRTAIEHLRSRYETVSNYLCAQDISLEQQKLVLAKMF